MRGRWGVHVCTCEGKLPVDGSRLQSLAPFVDIGQHPSTSAESLVTKAKNADVDSVLIACCHGTEPFVQAARARGVPLHTAEVAHKARCFLPTKDAAAANGKALRLLRGELRAASHKVAPEEIPLHIGNRVVLVTDHPLGLTLADALHESVRLTVVVGTDQQLPEDFPSRRANRGRLVAVDGKLGSFSTQVAAGGSERTFASDQVVVALRNPPKIKWRTGLHFVGNSEPGDWAAVSGALQDLIGDFMKPVAVRYDLEVCAGGTAGKEACGRCIPACPYHAIARDPRNPLRIAVDQLACEACGACTAACPTSALTYTEPTGGELLNRIAGMLGPAPGAPQPPLSVLFHCGRQGRYALDAAGERELEMSPRLLPVEVPCLRHVSDALVLSAFRMGAAGVAVVGCETCPHGERELLHRNLDIAQRVTEAAGFGAGRIKLVPVHDGSAQPEPALEELNAFAASLRPSPITFEADRAHAAPHHELVGDAIRAFIGQLGPRSEPVTLPEGSLYARAEVRAAGCTLCRSCANVCPSHAFRFDDHAQALEFKQMACVACGLCESVCPEHVITLRPELSLTEGALDYQVLAQDEQVYCAKCSKPYINKRALRAVEDKIRNAPQLAGVFEGHRAGMLRMCPDCRAVAAMLNVRDGWQP